MSQIQVSVPVSKYKDLTYLRTKKQYRTATPAKKRPIIGMDTETDQGNIFLLADSQGNRLEHPNISFEEIAQFLLRNERAWIFFYNMSYDAECILKLLPKKVFDPYRQSKEMKFTYHDYVIFYIPGKRLTIRKGRHTVSCYDIAQYFDNKPLKIAYEENIGKSLNEDYLQTKEKRSSFSLRYFQRHKREIRKYCIQDCKMTKELAEYWIELFCETFGFYPRSWISSGYLAEKVLVFNQIPIPYFHEIEYPIQDLAWRCFYGGRFELIKRGFIGECYLYDINSAYPYALTQIPDITNGKWFDGTKINPKSKLGFFHIRAIISDDVKIAPFPFKTQNDRIIYPTGEFETFVTLEELKSVFGDDRISYKILDSYQFIPAKNCEYPFRDFIETLYYKRLKLKEEKNPLERAIKVILNSIYGKMAQRVSNRMGNLFVPVISSSITGFARAQMYDFMRKNRLENETVAFATDSLACTRKIPGLDSLDLGDMKLDKSGNDAYFLSNGFYRFNCKWKNRGIGYDSTKKLDIEHLDTRIGEDGQLYIVVQTLRNTHLKSGIIYDKLDKIGKLEKYEKKIGLNSDRKRFWLSKLTSIDDMIFCDSMPIPIDLVGDIVSKKEFDWAYEEKYEPESDL